MSKQEPLTVKLDMDTQFLHVWQPTPLLRWKKMGFNLIGYNKVLQQKWISNTGEQRWCDIKEED